MTTPKDKAGKAKARLSRSNPARLAPKRARALGGGVPDGPGGASGPAPPSGEANDATINQSVAHAVKLGYDVIAENIKQGREAAQAFRKGNYNMREVPGDLEVAAMRLLQLARELSTTTFDVCERLLKEVGAKAPAADRASDIPPFRASKAANGTPPKASPAAAKPADPGLMKVTVRFAGAGKALAHTETLARPRQPTAVAEISAQPLAPPRAGGPPIAGVSFESDVSVEGIVAVVTLPKGQAPGVYSGLVHAGRDDVPLGVLTIEIRK